MATAPIVWFGRGSCFQEDFGQAKLGSESVERRVRGERIIRAVERIMRGVERRINSVHNR